MPFLSAMKIKFNTIQDLSDARYASAAMAEWMGFAVGGLPIDKVQEIIGWCSGPKLTLELPSTNHLETAISWCTILPVEAIECPIEEYTFWHPSLRLKNIEWILLCKNNYSPSDNIKTDDHPSDNEPFPIAQDTFNWQIWEEVCKGTSPTKPHWYHFEKFNPNPSLTSNAMYHINSKESKAIWVKNQHYAAISLQCEKETVLGLKNYDLWNELLETLGVW